MVTTWIRSMHPYAYRSGEWATLVNTVEYGGRDCYLVRFEDGSSDWWVKDDGDAEYEFDSPPERLSDAEATS